MENMIIADDVRDVCLPNKTFDTPIFQKHIAPAELQYMKPFLGKDFYAKLVEGYTADTLSPANAALIENYLREPLAWFTFAKASAFMHIQVRNGGFYVNNSEFSQGASSSQRSEIYNVIVQNAEALMDRAKEYIEDNSTDFPLYDASENIDNTTNFDGGLILDSSS